MIALILIGLIGGLITGVSPCVLPMLPIIFFASATGKAPAEAGRAGTSAARTPQREPVGIGAAIGGAPAAAAPPRPPAAAPSARRTHRSRRTPIGARPLQVIAGLVLSFGAFTLLGSVILAALHLPDSFLHWGGVVILATVGLALVFPVLEDLIQRPFWRLPKIQGRLHGNAFVLGLGLGTLYVPCAGPVLAAVTVAGATGRIGAGTIALTVAFAFGSAIPLLVFAAAGERIRERVSAYRRWSRLLNVIGGLVLVGLAVALALGATDAIQRVVPNYTQSVQTKIEGSRFAQGALGKVFGYATQAPPSTPPPAAVTPTPTPTQTSAPVAPALPVPGRPTASPKATKHAVIAPKPVTPAVRPLPPAGSGTFASCFPNDVVLDTCGAAPPIKGIDHWLNTPGSAPIDLTSLKGKVVLIDFWAYSCINCQRAIPHVQAWYTNYEKDGLVVIGVHAPEFAFEHSTGNVEAAIRSLGITYPVAQDNELATWTSYRNQYWPADYLIDSNGTLRHVGFGEGNYSGTEQMIRSLLTSAHPSVQLPKGTDIVDTHPTSGNQTPETYYGTDRSDSYRGPIPLRPDTTTTFAIPATQPQDTYSLAGTWSARGQYLESDPGSRLRLAYRATIVYMVLGGDGTVQVNTPGHPPQTVVVQGPPMLYTLVMNDAARAGTLTATANGNVDFYTATFG